MNIDAKRFGVCIVYCCCIESFNIIYSLTDRVQFMGEYENCIRALQARFVIRKTTSKQSGKNVAFNLNKRKNEN